MKLSKELCTYYSRSGWKLNIVNFVGSITEGAHVDEVFLPVVCGVNIVKLNLMLLQQQLIAEVFDYPATTTHWVRILKKVTKI